VSEVSVALAWLLGLGKLERALRQSGPCDNNATAQLRSAALVKAGWLAVLPTWLAYLHLIQTRNPFHCCMNQSNLPWPSAIGNPKSKSKH